MIEKMMTRKASRDEANKLEAYWRSSERALHERRREALREAWRLHHSRMSALHASLASEHERKARALKEATP